MYYLISTVIIGMICGIVPAVIGAIRGKLELGMFGFIASVVSAVILSYYLAIPVSLLFTILIIKNRVTATTTELDNVEPFTKEQRVKARL